MSQNSSMVVMKSDSEDDFVIIDSEHTGIVEKLGQEHKRVIKALIDKHVGELAMLRDSCNRRAQDDARTASLSVNRHNERYQEEIRDLKDALAAEKDKTALTGKSSYRMSDNNQMSYKNQRVIKYTEQELQAALNKITKDNNTKAQERINEGKTMLGALIVAHNEALSDLAHQKLRIGKVITAHKYEVAQLRIQASEAGDEAFRCYHQAQSYYADAQGARDEAAHKDQIIQVSQQQLQSLQAQLYEKTQEAVKFQSQLDASAAKNNELVTQLDAIRKIDNTMSTSEAPSNTHT
ncbi:hypothetical protein CORC01_10222 [Colletotrichum orchidophilum]|uniref:Cyclic nucleotide-binding domain-containing protein n=1 Tax=Colletotrichum orchidophilum TaxID=1209926 RepID=A0A1G4AZM7_9PEZI|nr:uncharacterized protein CORC01_10222 [Colletotrichum orchidophilum]OHE94502.1 hypothetical protein CORC01_10222 [Colletotrichum orchidophilum]